MKFKKVIVCILAVLIVLPVSNLAFAEEIQSNSEEMSSKSLEVANDGEEEGANDISTVNPRLKIISTDPNYIQNQISIFGAGTWDLMGSSTFKSKSKTFSSHGGDFRMLITQKTTKKGLKWLYELREEDPLNDDDLVDEFELPNLTGTFEMKWNVRSFTDGKNKKAELYLWKLTQPSTSVSITAYD